MENGRYAILAAVLLSITIKICRWEKENKF
jgi:hypothetical protein